VPLGGALIASLVLGAATAPLMQRRPFETRREALARQGEAMGDAAGTVVDAAGTAVELGSAYVENVIDYLSDD
jgi:hypothetical protein